MYWKEIASLEDLNPETNSLKITSHITINHPDLKKELMERKVLKLGMLDVKVVEGKILASLPSLHMPHIVD